MGREHINARLSTEVLQGVDAYASEHKTSRSAAIENLLSLALDMGQQQAREEQGTTGELETLRDYVETLKSQIAVKDSQIDSLSKHIDQAQQVQARITMALPIAQQDGPQDAQQAPQTATQPQDASQGDTAPQDSPRDAQQPQDSAQEGQGARTDKKQSWFSRLFS